VVVPRERTTVARQAGSPASSPGGTMTCRLLPSTFAPQMPVSYAHVIVDRSAALADAALTATTPTARFTRSIPTAVRRRVFMPMLHRFT
jgi:hypothetical protein